jgi:hypothetical protein
MVPTTPLGATLSASGALLAAAPGQVIRVHALVAVSTSAITLTLQSNATAISGAFPLAANGGFSLPFSESPWFQTVRGEGLNALLSSGSSTGFQLIYSLA